MTKLESFLNDLLNQKIGIGRYPHLWMWFQKKDQEISQIPDEVVRKGVPKGDQPGMQRAKIWLALLLAISPRFTLKAFAEAFGVPYGSVRHWTGDPSVMERAEEFAADYVDSITKDIEKRYKAPELDQADAMIRELSRTRFLSIFLLSRVADYENRMFAVTDRDMSADDSLEWLEKHGWLERLMVLSFFGDETVWSPEFQQYLLRKTENAQRLLDILFGHAETAIREGRPDDALKMLANAKSLAATAGAKQKELIKFIGRRQTKTSEAPKK